jgi:hypothetical protein
MPGARARTGAALVVLAAAALAACGSEDDGRAEPAVQSSTAAPSPATTTTAAAQPAAHSQSTGLAGALRRGGHVLVFRHAATDHSQADAQRFEYSQCARQRNLDAAGRA